VDLLYVQKDHWFNSSADTLRSIVSWTSPRSATSSLRSSMHGMSVTSQRHMSLTCRKFGLICPLFCSKPSSSDVTLNKRIHYHVIEFSCQLFAPMLTVNGKCMVLLAPPASPRWYKTSIGNSLGKSLTQNYNVSPDPISTWAIDDLGKIEASPRPNLQNSDHKWVIKVIAHSSPISRIFTLETTLSPSSHDGALTANSTHSATSSSVVVTVKTLRSLERDGHPRFHRTLRRWIQPKNS
jgi:hypothetical protein